MTFSSIVTDYLGEGVAASRPAAPNVAPSALALYFATDTGALSAYDVGTAAWVQILPENAWGVGTVTALGTVTGGVTLAVNSDTLQALGGWQAGAITALGTVSGGATVVAAGNTLTVEIPAAVAQEWNAGTITALETLAAGPTISAAGGTLSASAPQFLGIFISVAAITTAALPANTYANGTAGVGATLTATANGALSVDGDAVSAGDIVLINNEVAGAHNGPYTVTNPGGPSAAYVLTRTPGLDNAAALVGTTVLTSGAGSTFPSSLWFSANNLPLTVGTSVLSWAPNIQPDPPLTFTTDNELTLNFGVGLGLDGSNNLIAQWQAGTIAHLGTVGGGVTLSAAAGTLQATGGWAGGAVTNLGTVAGGVTLSASGGTLTATGGWAAGSATVLAGSMSLNSGTLSNEAQGTLTLSGTTTGTVSPITGFNSYLVNVGTAAGTISVANGSINGQEIRLDIKQGITAHTVVFDGTVIFGTDITSFTASTNPGTIDMVKLIWGGTHWRFSANVHGFAS